jgi:hypothetical protein
MLRDLTEDSLIEFGPGERLWKLFCFRPAAGQATRLEHRIYTKVKPDSHLGLVTFAVHSPVPGKPVRSGIARVADLPPEALDRIIHAIREETHVGPEEDAEIDLSSIASLDEQLAYLREQQQKDSIS